MQNHVLKRIRGTLIRLGPIFTKPSNTFSMAFKKVLEGFVARIP